jgi:hypothetical protein
VKVAASALPWTRLAIGPNGMIEVARSM